MDMIIPFVDVVILRENESIDRIFGMMISEVTTTNIEKETPMQVRCIDPNCSQDGCRHRTRHGREWDTRPCSRAHDQCLSDDEIRDLRDHPTKMLEAKP